MTCLNIEMMQLLPLLTSDTTATYTSNGTVPQISTDATATVLTADEQSTDASHLLTLPRCV